MNKGFLTSPRGKATRTQRTKSVRSSAVVQALEPRLLFSADVLPVALSESTQSAPQASVQQAPASSQANAPSNQSHIVPSQLVVLDLGITDSQVFLDALKKQQTDAIDKGERFEILTLNRTDDGIARISEALSQQIGTTSLHLIGHGDEGMMRLGASWFDAATLRSRASEISAWGGSLSSAADILIYGCDFAKAAGGQQFVRDLSQVTGADVAASIDLTGNRPAGGNWLLEFEVGSVESSTQVIASAAEQWQGRLFTIMVTNTNDSGGGSLRQAIINANAFVNTSGVDRIEFAIPTTDPGYDAATGVFRINVTTALPVITDGVVIDGASQAINIGNTNAGAMGPGGTVGVQNIALAQVQRPEIEIVASTSVSRLFEFDAADISLRGLALYGAGTEVIFINSAANNAIIENNVIGSGAAAFTDPGATTRSQNHLISGLQADDGMIRNNLLGFSNGQGIQITAGTDRWLIEGNFMTSVGLGNAALDMVWFEGVDVVVRANRFSANNSSGIEIGNTSLSAIVENNTISGSTGAEGFAVRVSNGSTGGLFQFNIVTGNTGAGIFVEPTASITIFRNSFSGNTSLGIDLASFGVTPNDTGDTDSGANSLQNFPILISASQVGSAFLVSGSLNSTPNSNFRIEFFASPSGDSTGFGEASEYVGTIIGATDALGSFVFYTTFFAVTVPTGYSVTSTATLLLGGSNYGGTSEFSQNVVSTGSAAGVTVTPPANAITTEAGSSATFSVVLNSQPTADVTIGLSVSDHTEGFVNSSTITFTQLNWNIAQTVTVSGVDDYLLDGARAYSVITTVTSSADPSYNGVVVDDVAFATPDNDLFNTFWVDTTSDVSDGDTNSIDALYANKGADGKLSLREALIAANNTVNPGGIADRIYFNIPTALTGGVHQITTTSSLPLITDAVFIDGTTDPDYVAGAAPVIRLEGNSGNFGGLFLASGSDGSNVIGLMITGFNNIGINIQSNANTIELNYIGTDGINDLGNSSQGIFIAGDNNIIGTATRGNLISGNGFEGIAFNNTANFNTIAANYIGTNATGTATIKNDLAGVYINSGADDNTIGTNTVGGGNLISGNTYSGIDVNGANRTLIFNNIIGLSASGQNVLGNGASGIQIQNGSGGTQVGNIGTNYANTISANGAYGVFITGATTNANFITANKIGTNTSANLKLGNLYSGVGISGGAFNNIIGGASVGAGNTIGGNSDDGVFIGDAATNGNRVIGNYIGSDASGSLNLGNADNGVQTHFNAGANSIGGALGGEGNLIAFNGSNGVLITEGNSIAVLGNSIFSNASLGINLGADYITPNDPSDTDTGPNGLQNFPVINAVTLVGASIEISGSLNSIDNTTYRIEVFRTAIGNGDVSAHGEAKQLVGWFETSIAIGSGSTGFVSSFIPLVPVTLGDVITTTATVKRSPTTFGATSEFSQNATLAPAATASISGRLLNDTEADGSLISNTTGLAATVYLFKDDGDGIANAADAFVATSNTDSGGNYLFNNLAAGNYWVVVDSRSISALLNAGYAASSTWWEQTYGNGGALLGGENLNTSDGFTGAAATLASAEHITQVVLAAGANTTDLNYGFSSNAILTTRDGDDDLGNNRSMQGSLRQFIQNSNALTGVQTSMFRLTNGDANYNGITGVWRFNVGASLPILEDGTVIDGFTQRTWGGNTNGGNFLPIADPLRAFTHTAIEQPEIEIVGTGAASAGAGISITGSGSRIAGLSVYGFSSAIFSNASGSIIEQNFLGATAENALDPVSNRISYGVEVNGGTNTIIRENYIANTSLSGVFVSFSNGATISGNIIHNTGLGSVIDDGINISGVGSGLVISQNSILASRGNGIDIAITVSPLISNNFISGFGLAGNERTGIAIRNNNVSLATIQLNTVTQGTYGIFISDNSGTDPHQIGGVGLGNVLVGLSGVGISLDGTHSVRIQGNRIGVTSSGAAMPNVDTGIWAASGAFNTLVGGANAGEGNVIANATIGYGTGILLPLQSTVLGNSIYQNAAIGITLTSDRYNTAPNDLNDADLTAQTGPQNYPVVISAVAAGLNTQVSGSLNSRSNATFRVEVFRNPAAMIESNGYPEGAEYLGFFDVTTDATGNVLFNQLVSGQSFAGDKITMTATQNSGAGSYGYSSEFSYAAVVTVTSAGVTVTPISGLVVSEAGSTAQFSVVLNSPPTANVTINLSVSDANEASINTSTLTFTAANWNIAQTVTVTGLDDSFVDGNIPFSVVTSSASSIDLAYSGLTIQDVTLSSTDNDTSNTIFVDTTSDVADGDTSSIGALYANKGADGFVSLREAILASNNTPNGTAEDLIRFSISAPLIGGLHTIAVTSELPKISDRIRIDGSSEPDFVGPSPVIQLSGTSAGGGKSGFRFDSGSDSSYVHSIWISDFSNVGIEVHNTSNVSIGGIGLGNVITSNTGGGIIVSGTSIGTKIAGNAIGTNFSRSAGLGNGDINIQLAKDSFGALVGGTSIGSANIIANTTLNSGIVVFSGSADNAFLGNVIYGNFAAQIDNGANGLTANDLDDNDNGGNGLQNTPVLISAFSSGGNTTINGTLQTEANKNYRIEFFSAPTGSADSHGGSQTYLGFVNVSTSPSGNASFNPTLVGVTVAAGNIVTAIATEILSVSNFGSSSEFAQNVIATGAAPGINVSAPTSLTVSEGGASSQFTVVLTSPPTADVTIALSLSDPSEATLSTTLLTFTAANWNIAQTVTVTGLDDRYIDGNQAFTVVTTTSVSTDIAYSGLTVSDVTLTNLDNDNLNLILVDTTSDAADGDTSSVAALYNNRGADGKISLREAILAANNTSNGALEDRITFGIADPLIGGTHTINVLSALPSITDSVQILGTTQPSYTTKPIIRIDGGGANVNGIFLTAPQNTITGLMITGFNQSGLVLASDNNIILSNFIGTDGVVDLGNARDGIAVAGSGNIIGLVNSGNVISGNGLTGISMFSATSTGNKVVGNVIGLNAAGTLSIPNDSIGILVRGSNTTILQNQIDGSGTLGIDLGEDGVTLNDLDDVDVGANGFQNFPVLISAFSASGDSTINGTLNSNANTNYRIEFYSSPFGDVNGFGEGRQYLGFVIVATNASGSANFSQLLSGITVAAGSAVTATATVDLGAASYGSTSEFALNVLASGAPPGVTVSGPSTVTTTEAGTVSQFTVVLNAPPSANVTISLSVSDASEASLSTTTLVFNASNWNIPQIVTVTGLDDSFIDGNVAYSVITSNVVSTDLAYSGMVIADLALTNFDNDTFNTLVVDTTSDAADGDTSSIAALSANKGADGKISLREAILASNNTANGVQRDQILFNIADPLFAGAHTINVLSALPTISDAVFIDGTTEPDYGPAHVIELNGTSAGASNGLVISSNGSRINGLTINRFAIDGMQISGSGNTITNNYIGVDVTGNTARANARDGILLLNAANTVIGGATSNLGNVIAGNGNIGLEVGGGTGSANVVIQNNFIGVNATATGILSNGNHNVWVVGAGSTNYLIGGGLGLGNVIGGSFQRGILISPNVTSGGEISFNAIGTNFSGTASLGNASLGMLIHGSNVNIFSNRIENNGVAGIYVATGGLNVAINGNTFANEAAGVLVTGTPQGVSISQNQMDLVGQLIDLGSDGITPNDLNDVDTGPNGLQNTATLTSISTDGLSSFRLLGNFNGVANQTFTVEVYEHGNLSMANRSRFAGNFTITTDATGNATFNQTLAGSFAAGTLFSVTVTDTAVSNATSEHSAAAVSISPAVIVTPTSGLVVNEGGTSASFSVVLSTAPIADVVITLNPSIAGEVLLNTTTITFTSTNWNTAQFVTLTGMQDLGTDGNRVVTIITSAATSTDLSFNNLNVNDVVVTNNELPNQAAQITAPLSYAAVEDTVLVLGGGSSGISITDVDAGNALLDVTLTVDNGAFSLGSVTGLSFLSGNGIADSTVTFRATVANINAALASITYAPTANFFGNANLSLVVNDLGNSGSGGQKISNQNIVITIAAVNDAPIFNGSASATIAEGGAIVLTNSMLNITDVDTNTSDLVFSIKSQTSDGDIQMGGVSLRVGDSFTQSDIDRGRVQYFHLGAEGQRASITFGVSERFGIALTDVQFNLAVTPVNDAPVIEAIRGDTLLETTRKGEAVGIVTVTDSDNSNGAVFSLVDSSSGTFIIDATTGAITVGDPLLIDFETLSEHTIRVRVIDAAGATSERSFKIKITDLPEFVPITPSTPVQLSNPNNTSVLTSGTVVNVNNSSGSGSRDEQAGLFSLLSNGSSNIDNGSQNGTRGGGTTKRLKDVWVDPNAGASQAQQEATQRSTQQVELALVNGQNEVLTKRVLNSDSLASFLLSRNGGNLKNASPSNVYLADFNLPKSAQVGKVEDSMIDESNGYRNVQIVLDSVEMGGMVLSVGVVAWVARAGGLVAALLSAVPAWKGMDPLVVLAPAKKSKEQDLDEFSDTELREDEEAVQAVIG